MIAKCSGSFNFLILDRAYIRVKTESDMHNSRSLSFQVTNSECKWKVQRNSRCSNLIRLS